MVTCHPPIANRDRAAHADPQDLFVCPFVVSQDSREQAPWAFQGIVVERRLWIIRRRVATLQTGDYSIAGCEDRLVIERKSAADLVGSVTAGNARFRREHERMQAIVTAGGFACVIVEGSLSAICDELDQDSRPAGDQRVDPGGRRVVAAAVRRPLAVRRGPAAGGTVGVSGHAEMVERARRWLKLTNAPRDQPEILSRLDVAAEYEALGVRLRGQPRASGMVSCYAYGRDDRSPSAWINIRSGCYGDSGGRDAAAYTMSLWDFAVKVGRFPGLEGGAESLRRESRRHDRPGEDQTDSGVTDWREQTRIAELGHPRQRRAGTALVHGRQARRHRRGDQGGRRRAGLLPAAGSTRRPARSRRRRNCHQVIALPCYGSWFLDADPVAWQIFDVTGQPFDVTPSDMPPTEPPRLGQGFVGRPHRGHADGALVADDALRSGPPGRRRAGLEGRRAERHARPVGRSTAGETRDGGDRDPSRRRHGRSAVPPSEAPGRAPGCCGWGLRRRRTGRGREVVPGAARHGR